MAIAFKGYDTVIEFSIRPLGEKCHFEHPEQPHISDTQNRWKTDKVEVEKLQLHTKNFLYGENIILDAKKHLICSIADKIFFFCDFFA